MIEIGPGRGAYTRALLPLVDELHVVEIDGAFVGHLQRQFAGVEKLKIHKADVLQTDLSQWGPAIITGNVPYYITSPILEKFLALGADFPVGVFLIQLEVANRVIAKSMTRDFGYLTVAAQLVCSAELICKVDPKYFDPPPKVDSAAIRLTRRSDVPEDLADILTFASRCFRQKRKTLRNNLRAFYGPAIDRQPEGLMRAEQLGVSGVVELYRRLHAEGPTGLDMVDEKI